MPSDVHNGDSKTRNPHVPPHGLHLDMLAQCPSRELDLGILRMRAFLQLEIREQPMVRVRDLVVEARGHPGGVAVTE